MVQAVDDRTLMERWWAEERGRAAGLDPASLAYAPFRARPDRDEVKGWDFRHGWLLS